MSLRLFQRQNSRSAGATRLQDLFEVQSNSPDATAELPGSTTAAAGPADPTVAAEPPEPLPDGWEQAVDDNGRVYYIEVESREVTFNRPSAAAEASRGHRRTKSESSTREVSSVDNIYDHYTVQIGG